MGLWASYKKRYMKKLGFIHHEKFNWYVNTSIHEAVDGRTIDSHFYSYYKDLLKPHLYGFWKIYSHTKLSNDIIDTVIRPSDAYKKDYILSKIDLGK